MSEASREKLESVKQMITKLEEAIQEEPFIIGAIQAVTSEPHPQAIIELTQSMERVQDALTTVTPRVEQFEEQAVFPDNAE